MCCERTAAETPVRVPRSQPILLVLKCGKEVEGLGALHVERPVRIHALGEGVALLRLCNDLQYRLSQRRGVLLEEGFGEAPPSLDPLNAFAHALVALRRLHPVEHLHHPLGPGAQFELAARAACPHLAEALRDELLHAHR